MTRHMACHVVISGRVQGVFYRAWSETEAGKLDLSGWVRNRLDGTVEAVFCGSSDNVADMIGRCAHGPLLARVDDVRTQPCDIPLERGFFKRSTV